MARKGLLTATLTLPGGKRKYIYGKTKAELEEKLLEAKLLLRAGVNPGNDVTFFEYAQAWYNSYKKPYLRDTSRENLLYTLNSYIVPYLSSVKMSDVTPMHIQQILSSVSEKSRSLNNKVLQTLRHIFDTAVDNNVIVKSPVPLKQKSAGKKTEEKKPLTKEQENILIEALEGTRASLFVLIGLKTGMRREEILGLNWDCVDLEKRLIYVMRTLVLTDKASKISETTKTDSGNRLIPIPDSLYKILTEEKEKSNSEWLFATKDGKPLTRSSFRKLWGLVETRKTSNQTELNEKHRPEVKRIIDFHVTPHILRHTYITRLFEAGLDIKQVQYLAGHKTPDITMKIYIHFCEETRRDSTFDMAKAAIG